MPTESSSEFICQAEHTPHPEGYIAHAEWAERMLVTHRQIKCPGCGLWKVWIPRDELAVADARQQVAGTWPGTHDETKETQ